MTEKTDPCLSYVEESWRERGRARVGRFLASLLPPVSITWGTVPISNVVRAPVITRKFHYT